MSVLVTLLCFTWKTYYISYWNKKSSSNFFLIFLNEIPLYLKIWSPLQPPYQKVILCPEKSWFLILKQTCNALTGIYIFFKISVFLKTYSANFWYKWTLLYYPWIVMFLGFTNTKISNNHKLVSLSNLPLLFHVPLPFWGKNVPPLKNCLENRQNSNLCKVGRFSYD